MTRRLTVSLTIPQWEALLTFALLGDGLMRAFPVETASWGRAEIKAGQRAIEELKRLRNHGAAPWTRDINVKAPQSV